MSWAKKVMGFVWMTALLASILFMGMTVYATDTTQETLYLQKGETYSFTNNGAAEAVVTYENGADCVIYNADGSVESDYGWGNAEIPAGGKLVLTADYAYVEATYDKSVITAKKEKESCFEQVVLTKSAVYAFRNISGEERTLDASDSAMKPYILYDADGNIAEYDTTIGWDEMDIPAGYTLKLQGIDAESVLKVSFVRGSFSVTEESTPIFDTAIVLVGEGYSFKNISGKSMMLFSCGGVRDWRLLDASGAVVSEAIGDKWGTGGEVKKEIPAGHTIELTATHNIDVLTVRGTFQIQKMENPTLRWIYINPGDTYSFTNKTGTVRTMVEYNHSATDMQKDWVIFDSAGNVVSQHVDEKWSSKSIDILPGQTIKVTPRFRNMPVGIFTDEFDYKHEDTPVFSRNILIAGDKYSFKNISDRTQKMAGTNYVAYELYNAEGSMISSSESTMLNTISVGVGETIYISTSGESLALYDAFEVKKVSGSEESEYFDVAYGKTYKVKNTGTSRYTWYIEDTGITYGCISYSTSGKRTGFGNGYSNLFMESGAYVLITFYGNTSFYHSPVLEIEEVEDPLFDTWILEPYKIYSFENINEDDGMDVSIGAPAVFVGYSEEYDFPTRCNISTGSSGGEKEVAEMKAYEGRALAVHGEVQCTEESQIAYAKAEFAAGESGRITNSAAFDYWIEFSGYIDRIERDSYTWYGPMDYLEHKDGWYHGIESLSVSPDGCVEFTAITDVCFWYPIGMLTFEKIEEPIVEYFSTPDGETTLIKNTGSSQITVIVMTDNCDYVEYDGNGKIKSGSADNGLKNEKFQKTFTLGVNERVAVTANTADLTIIAPKGTVSLEKREYPAYHMKMVLPGESFAYKNIQDGEITIDCPVGGSVKYVIYNKNDIVEEDKTGYLYSLDLSAGYRVEVTEVADPMVFSGYYEIMRTDMIFVNDFSIAKDGDSATVKIGAYNIPEVARVMTAVYSEDGKIMDVKTLELDTNGVYSSDISLKDATDCKAFIWGEAATLSPLCGESETELAE